MPSKPTARSRGSQDVTSALSADAQYLPEERSVESLRLAEQSCRGCELYQRATQAVGGEGPTTARMLIVREAPGDEEDKKGRPFVGPAGVLLDEALEAAGIKRTDLRVATQLT